MERAVHGRLKSRITGGSPVLSSNEPVLSSREDEQASRLLYVDQLAVRVWRCRSIPVSVMTDRGQYDPAASNRPLMRPLVDDRVPPL